MRKGCWILLFALLAPIGCAGTRPPLVPLEREVEVGFASYYASRFHGARTASGERYDEQAMTAAHRTLPFGTRVRVTNLTNGRSVVVTITDVSRRAARNLDFVRAGTARVRIRVLEN